MVRTRVLGDTLAVVPWRRMLLLSVMVLLFGIYQAEAQPELPDSLSYRLREAHIPVERVNVLNDIAWQLRHNDPDRALAYASRALHLADSVRYEEGKGWAERNIGVILYVQGKYAKALTANLRARRIFEALENTEGIASTFNNIGLIHWQLGDTEMALRYFRDALRLEPSPRVTATTLANLGLMHTEKGEYDMALKYTRRAQRLYNELHDSLGVSLSLNNIGWIDELRHDYDGALREYMHSLAIREKLGDRRRIASVCISIGSVLTKEKHNQRALDYLSRALALSRGIGEKKLVEAVYEAMTEAYVGMGDYVEGYNHLARYIAVKDSIIDEKISRDIARMEANFKLERTEKELELVKRTNQLQQTIVYAASGGLLLVLIFSIISFFGYRSKARINRQLRATQKQLIVQEKLASLGQLTAGIAHEIQNPLNFINNFSEVSQELIDELGDASLKEEDRERILADLRQSVGKIHDHGSRADAIVRGMMTHARSSSEDRQYADVNALLGYVVDLAAHGTKAMQCARKLEFEKQLEPSLPAVRVVPQDLSQVFLNIMNNAIDAVSDRCAMHPEEGYRPMLTVSTDVEGSFVVIRIRDNGVGMPENVRNRIFEPFYTTKESGKGTGLGLSISYDIIVQKYDGKMDVESKEGDYTEFIIALPVE